MAPQTHQFLHPTVLSQGGKKAFLLILVTLLFARRKECRFGSGLCGLWLSSLAFLLFRSHIKYLMFSFTLTLFRVLKRRP